MGRSRQRQRAVGFVALALAAAGCGHAAPPVAFDPVPTGPGAAYRPGPMGEAAVHAKPIGALACRAGSRQRFVAHLEVFANRLVVAIPPGIGVAAPRRVEGAYVRGGRCSYPARTVEPTGVIEVAQGARLSLGDLFAIWGQPLSRRRVAGFPAPPGGAVEAFVAGRRWRGDPRAIPLARHAVIVLEVGGWVRPHSSYRFAPGR